MYCCLTAQTHYPSKYRIIVEKRAENISVIALATNNANLFENYIFEITIIFSIHQEVEISAPFTNMDLF